MNSGCIENSDWDTFSLETEGTKRLFLKREISQICSSTQDVCTQTSILESDMLSLQSGKKWKLYWDHIVNLILLIIRDQCTTLAWTLCLHSWLLYHTKALVTHTGFSRSCRVQCSLSLIGLDAAALQDSIHLGSKPMANNVWTMPGSRYHLKHSLTLFSESLTFYTPWFNCHSLLYVGVWENWLARNVASVTGVFSSFREICEL